MGPAGMGSPVPPAPRPFPESFPAAAPIDDLEFRPKRGKTIGILIAIVVVVGIVIAIVASSGPSTPAVPVPTVVPTPEPPSPVALPTPTPTPAPTPTPTPTSIPAPNTGGDPLNPSGPATAPRTGSDFTDLFAQGAKKLNPARPPGSSDPPPSPLTPP
jgi:hypothetical protein